MGGFLLCDEAHAAVYEVSIIENNSFRSLRRHRRCRLRPSLGGVCVRGGKIGFEGIEVDEKRAPFTFCSSGAAPKIRLRVTDLGTPPESQAPARRGDLVEVQLEDCTWRLTGLAWWKGRMIALRTKFPGMRYEVVRSTWAEHSGAAGSDEAPQIACSGGVVRQRRRYCRQWRRFAVAGG